MSHCSYPPLLPGFEETGQNCSYPPLLPGSPGLHSVVAEARSQDLILLVVRDLGNLATVGVLKWKGSSDKGMK